MKVRIEPLVRQAPLVAPISEEDMWVRPEAQPGLEQPAEIGRHGRLPEIGPTNLEQPPREAYPHGLHTASPTEAMRNRHELPNTARSRSFGDVSKKYRRNVKIGNDMVRPGSRKNDVQDEVKNQLCLYQSRSSRQTA